METQYDNKDICPNCKGHNAIEVTEAQEGQIHECETQCLKCGHENYWAYGSYQYKPSKGSLKGAIQGLMSAIVMGVTIGFGAGCVYLWAFQ